MKRSRCVSLALSLLLALGFCLIFAYSNTPLGPAIGSDNAIYLTMGTAIAQGYAPYTEVFDHKGPLLFLLQALPQAVAGGYSTLAVFVMEALFLLACLRAVCAIAGEVGAPRLPAQIAYLALICALTDGGNLTEEYSNLFTLLGILFALRAFAGERAQGERLFARALGMGAMTTLAFLMRANNALPLCAMTTVLALCLLARRELAPLGRCAGGFAAGLLLAVLPVVLWLAARGALGEAIYGSILHNMMYAETDGAGRLHMLLFDRYGHIALLLAALSCLGALTLWRRAPAMTLSLIAGAAGAGLAALISHKYYVHYLVLGAPCAVTGVALLLAAAKRRGKRLCGAGCALCVALCAAVLAVSGVQANESRLAWRGEDFDAFTADAQALYAQVPEQERESFMAYRVEPRWYVAAKALPCMRFYFLQEILAQADPAVMEEIVEEFESDPPRWLVIYYNREFGPPYDARVAAIFESDYEFVDARGQYQLLRLKGAGT